MNLVVIIGLLILALGGVVLVLRRRRKLLHLLQQPISGIHTHLVECELLRILHPQLLTPYSSESPPQIATRIWAQVGIGSDANARRRLEQHLAAILCKDVFIQDLSAPAYDKSNPQHEGLLERVSVSFLGTRCQSCEMACYSCQAVVRSST